jgi:hypothetical protein
MGPCDWSWNAQLPEVVGFVLELALGNKRKHRKGQTSGNLIADGMAFCVYKKR